MDPSKINKSYAERHLAIVNDMSAEFILQFPQYVPFLVYTKTVCDLINICIQDQKDEAAIDVKHANIENNKDQIEQLEHQVQNLKGFLAILETELKEESLIQNEVSIER